MSHEDKRPVQIREVLKKGLLKRLPLTFQPFLNEQLHTWDFLFPFEQQYLSRILTTLGGLDDEHFARLFHGLQEMEARMEVSRWAFSTREQTIENASLLARSPYYHEWRREVQKAFDEIDRQASANRYQASGRSENRLILLMFPDRLPLDRATAWKGWRGIGRELELDLDSVSLTWTFNEILFRGSSESGKRPRPSFVEAFAQKRGHSASDIWIIEAGSHLSGLLPELNASNGTAARATFLSWEKLKALRETFLQQLNAIRKDLSDADAVYSRLRNVDVEQWCPPEVASQPAVREFVRSLFLSGNGAVVFSNSFVEWAGSESLRRARPNVLIARFGTRNKPKLFTSVAIFENQEKASPLPEVEDLPGSALDAQVLAYYIWLSASRYPEYEHALCLCLAEGRSAAYALGPPDCPLWRETRPLTLVRLSAFLHDWLG